VSRGPRWILAIALVLFAWMTLSGWESDTPRVRAISAVMAGLMVLGAAGAVSPQRFVWALHIVAGAVALGYTWYFVEQVVALLGGEAQSIRFGRPSAVMAGIGMIVFAIPLGVFAVSGVRVGPFGRRLRGRTDADRDDPPAAI
jgi:hypothetical protein